MKTLFYTNDTIPYDRGDYPRLRSNDLIRTHGDNRVWKVDKVWGSNRDTEQRVWLILQVKEIDNYDETKIVGELNSG